MLFLVFRTQINDESSPARCLGDVVITVCVRVIRINELCSDALRQAVFHVCVKGQLALLRRK